MMTEKHFYTKPWNTTTQVLWPHYCLIQTKIWMSQNNHVEGRHYMKHVCTAVQIPVFCADRRCTPGIINRKSDRGETALMIAVTMGHLDCVQEMAQL